MKKSNSSFRFRLETGFPFARDALLYDMPQLDH